MCRISQSLLLCILFIVFGFISLYYIIPKEKTYFDFLHEVNKEMQIKEYDTFLKKKIFLGRWVEPLKWRQLKTEFVLLQHIALDRYLRYLYTTNNQDIEIWNFATATNRSSHWSYDELFGAVGADKLPEIENLNMYKRQLVAKNILLFTRDKKLNFKYGLFYQKDELNNLHTTKHKEIYERNIKDFRVFTQQANIKYGSWFFIILNKKTGHIDMFWENACVTSVCTEADLIVGGFYLSHFKSMNELQQHESEAYKWIDILNTNL